MPRLPRRSPLLRRRNPLLFARSIARPWAATPPEQFQSKPARRQPRPRPQGPDGSIGRGSDHSRPLADAGYLTVPTGKPRRAAASCAVADNHEPMAVRQAVQLFVQDVSEVGLSRRIREIRRCVLSRPARAPTAEPPRSWPAGDPESDADEASFRSESVLPEPSRNADQNQEGRLDGVLRVMLVAQDRPAYADTIGPWRSTRAANANSPTSSRRDAKRPSSSPSGSPPIDPILKRV